MSSHYASVTYFLNKYQEPSLLLISLFLADSRMAVHHTNSFRAPSITQTTSPFSWLLSWPFNPFPLCLCLIHQTTTFHQLVMHNVLKVIILLIRILSKLPRKCTYTQICQFISGVCLNPPSPWPMEPELRSLNFESMAHVSGIHTDAQKQQNFTHTHTPQKPMICHLLPFRFIKLLLLLQ